MLHRLDRFRDEGLLLLRLGIGFMFVLHGYPKLLGGPERWEGVGGAMANFGISFAPAFWGLMAALSETFGGLFLALGVFSRPACLVLLSTMIVATLHHLNRGDGIVGASHAIESAILFAALFIIGPGKYRLDSKLAGLLRKSSKM